MFTGIVQAVGTLRAIERRDGDARVQVAAAELGLEDVRVGDSIAVSGVCLTVAAKAGDGFLMDVSGETLARTTLGSCHPGDRVNLEKALAVGDRLGGHLVSGHVDGIATLARNQTQGRSLVMTFEAPAPLARYVAAKGSVCVDGVSLTVNRVEGAYFDVNLVPHTLDATTLGRLVPGAAVNLEVDLIARYLDRLVNGDAPGPGTGITQELLERLGLTRKPQ
jgi:riboflavin synthase